MTPSLDILFKKHTDTLKKIANSYIKYYQRDKFFDDVSLISEFYIYCRKSNFKFKTDNDFINLFGGYCYNSTEGFFSKKGKANGISIKKLLLEIKMDDVTPQMSKIDDTDPDIPIDLSEEELQLVSIGYEYEQAKKISFAKQCFHQLNWQEQKLYDLYFNKGLSTYKIADYYSKSGIKMSSAQAILKVKWLKEKIKKLYDDNN